MTNYDQISSIKKNKTRNSKSNYDFELRVLFGLTLENYIWLHVYATYSRQDGYVIALCILVSKNEKIQNNE